MVPDSDYRIKLQVFEGPLDLLLFLIRKNELDIYDIPIESVTRQYLEAIRAMQQLDLDVAGEFFVMAATLMEIKSRMLLPKGLHAVDPNAEEEEVDPRWELVHQLLQYKKFKEAAAKLTELSETRQNLMERYVSALSEPVERTLKSVDRIELWNAFNIVLRRLAEKLVVGEIHDEVVTVSDQMEWILTRTQSEKSFVFSHLFPEGVTLRRLVATFLAVLELTRLKKLRVRQNEAFSDIIVEAVEAASVSPPVVDATVPAAAATSDIPAENPVIPSAGSVSIDDAVPAPTVSIPETATTLDDGTAEPTETSATPDSTVVSTENQPSEAQPTETLPPAPAANETSFSPAQETSPATPPSAPETEIPLETSRPTPTVNS